MKLISTTDFVIETEKIIESDMDFGEWRDLQFSMCLNYAKFLKTPLSIGMFVPALDGKVLEDPEIIAKENNISLFNHCFTFNGYQKNLGVYREYFEEAKKRVLFEGWHLINSYPERGLYFLDNKPKSKFSKHILSLGFKSNKTRTIEDLVKYNLTCH